VKFSVCIPNYNYEKYLGETIASAKAQTVDLEVVMADNASTDGSVQLARSMGVAVKVNEANVGFAGNLDRAGRLATGDVMVMLSSDDLMRPTALSVYRDVLAQLGDDVVLSSAADIIDPKGAITGRLGPDASLWTEADRVHGLPVPDGAAVYAVDAPELLRRCLKTLRNPFHFLSTAYPRALYQRVEGYGGSRTINPDKWFHWKLLGVARRAVFIDAPLFAYRWHPGNQTAQQAASGALKYLVDEYVSSFELDAKLLERAGLTRADVERAFIEHDIARHGLATLAGGSAAKARRVLFFGASTYPAHLMGNWKAWALGGLLLAGPVGQWAARQAHGALKKRGALDR